MWPFRNYRAEALRIALDKVTTDMYEEIERRKAAEHKVRSLQEDVDYWRTQYFKLNDKAFGNAMDQYDSDKGLGARRCRGCTGDPYQTRCERGA